MGKKYRDAVLDGIAYFLEYGKTFKAFLGLDGFVDEILNVVDKRHNAENYTTVKTLYDMGKRISQAAGLSSNIELVGVVRKLGGNGTILANALALLGADVTYVGALGEQSVDPVFTQMGEMCRLISVADPARSFNLEFEDGKLIMSKLDSFNTITWQRLKDTIGVDVLTQMIEESCLLGLENWTMVPYMSGVFEGILEEVVPRLKPRRRMAFFDLADPEKRTIDDLRKAIMLIGRFSKCFDVTLGVNLKEAVQIASAAGISDFENMPPSNVELERIVLRIGEVLGLHCFAVHTLHDAGAYCNDEYHYAPGFYTAKPALTTGAGDNFNAGYCMGCMMGLSVSQSLYMGTAASGYYVRRSKSATLSELRDFVEKYALE